MSSIIISFQLKANPARQMDKFLIDLCNLLFEEKNKVKREGVMQGLH
jgi:hypothetical protein